MQTRGQPPGTEDLPAPQGRDEGNSFPKTPVRKLTTTDLVFRRICCRQSAQTDRQTDGQTQECAAVNRAANEPIIAADHQYGCSVGCDDDGQSLEDEEEEDFA